MKTLLILSLGLSLLSCKESPLHFAVKDSVPLNAEADFQTVKKAVLNPSCVGCHPAYRSYSEVRNDLNSIMEAVNSNRMPKGAPLTNVQKNFLRKWVSAGAPEGEPERDVDDGVLKPTWKSLSSNVLGPKCIQCHNPQGEAKFLDLSTREAIWNERARLVNFDVPENSYLLEVIQDPEEPMPPVWSGIERVSEKEVEVLREWIRTGLH